MNLPNTINTPRSRGGHIQGIAYDKVNECIYCSFTTELLKLDLEGNIVGSVVSLVGHLGCIAFDEQSRRLYGSLELKHDSIGRGIMGRTGVQLSNEDAFYVVSFDVDKIDRVGLHAEKDGIMTAAYLADVARDYAEVDEVSGCLHRYGCSGIDGITLCPAFDGSGKKLLTVAYGIYSEIERTDNDHQVLLQFDACELERLSRPLEQTAPHHSGEEMIGARCFFYTGNTSWGVQNLEYDEGSGLLLFAVYVGKKPEFTPFKLFTARADSAKPATLSGRGGESALLLEDARLGQLGEHGVYGSHFLYGSTGLCSLGDGLFYVSEPKGEKVEVDGEKVRYYSSTIRKYRFDPSSEELFVAL